MSVGAADILKGMDGQGTCSVYRPRHTPPRRYTRERNYIMLPYIGPEFIAVLTKRSIIAETSSSGENLPDADPHKSEAREVLKARVPLIYSDLFIAAVQSVLRWFL
jgi:hypothetical protein